MSGSTAVTMGIGFCAGTGPGADKAVTDKTFGILAEILGRVVSSVGGAFRKIRDIIVLKNKMLVRGDTPACMI